MMRPAFGEAALVNISPSEEIDVQVFPNPAANFVNIRITTKTDNATMSLYDIQGRKLWERPLSTTFAVSNLTDGLYLLRITDAENGRQTIKKVIIKH